MNSTRTEVLACREPFRCNDVDILVCRREILDGIESVFIAEPVVMRRLTQVELWQRKLPTVSLPPDAAQQLMDELWRCGLRPTEGSGSAGQLAAVQYHLEDMRSLAFGKQHPEIRITKLSKERLDGPARPDPAPPV